MNLEISFLESPVRTNEFTESFCNWDVEYNNISLNGRPIRRNLFESKTTNIECMDISHITTPKSKIINSQRKKLSNSFKLSESLSDDEILNMGNEEVKLKRNLSARFDTESLSKEHSTQDTGYLTGSELSHRMAASKTDDDMAVCDITDHLTTQHEGKENWNPNIFASTPSKRYFYDIGK